MEQDEALDEQTNRYIHNKMDAAELSQFESKLASDPSLKKEVEQLQQLKSFYNKDIVDFKRILKEAELRYREKSTVTKEPASSPLRKMKGRWLAFAAAIILIVGTFYLSWNKVDIVQLAKENSLDGLNKASARKGDSIAVADLLFYSGSYREYIQKAVSLLKENPRAVERSILNINICKSYIQLNQADSAILFYQSLSSEEKGYCYLQYQAGLAYTIINNKKDADRLFELVVKAGCFPVDEKAAEWIKKNK